jgi:hypothetical protein
LRIKNRQLKSGSRRIWFGHNLKFKYWDNEFFNFAAKRHRARRLPPDPNRKSAALCSAAS